MALGTCGGEKGSRLAKHWNVKVDLERLLHTLFHLILVTSGTGDSLHLSLPFQLYFHCVKQV